MSAPPDTHLLDAICVAAQTMPRGHIESLAASIESEEELTPRVAALALGAVASPVYRQNASHFLEGWSSAGGASGAAVALALRAAATARDQALREQRVEVVWTDPTSHDVPLRRTREELLELVELAVTRLTVVSFAAFRVEEVLSAL